MWHCLWCGEMTLAFYDDPLSHLCEDCQDELVEWLWTGRVRLLEEVAP